MTQAVVVWQNEVPSCEQRYQVVLALQQRAEVQFVSIHRYGLVSIAYLRYIIHQFFGQWLLTYGTL